MTKKKILICDDDEDILEMLALILERIGCTIIAEKNSLNLYNIIDQQQPDLVLLDLWMPVLSGDQVVRTLRSNPLTKDLPVIIVSAARDGLHIAGQAGATEFIAKPFDIDLLIGRVKHYLN